MSKLNISATLDEDLLKRVDAFVKDSERNRSWLISKALEAYLDDQEDLQIAKSRLQDDYLTSEALREEIGL